MNLKCLLCAGEEVMAEAKRAMGEDVEIPTPEDAYTMAPSWQERRIMGNLVMACIALPTCKRHLEVQELSPMEQAIRNGQLLQGTVGEG